MKKIYFLAIASFLLVLLSCGDSNKSDTEIDLGDVKEFSEHATDAMALSEERQKQRRERGDTVAMPYSELKNFLPSINSYVANDEPNGSQMNVPGMGSWSQVEQSFSNGDKTIDVTLFDYNGAFGAFSGATALYSMGFSQEDGDKKSGSTDIGIDGVVAYETVYKKSQRAELILIIVDRFFVTMNVDGTNDIGVLKDAAKGMKLDELVKK